MATMYYEKDARLDHLQGRTVGIIGYGIQGRGQGLNVRDSGLHVIIGQRAGGPNHAKALEDGFTPMSAEEVAQQADVIMLLTQDTVQSAIYEQSIAPHLKPGKALGFSHGFNIHFKQITPSKDVDVFMIAPKGPGSLVRSQYAEGKGVPALVAIHQDASGHAKDIALAYAQGIGATRAGVIETTFAEETETDLFGEQAVLCGGVSALIQAGFDTLVQAGYQPEVAYFECLHELKLITDMIYATGISGMRRRVSDTAEYGDLTRGPRVINAQTRQEMQNILREIQSGDFAREWVREDKAQRPKFTRLLEQGDAHPVEAIGAQLRGMMPWMKNS